MRGCGTWAAIGFWSCAGCCCLRIPTCGLWPDIDEAELQAKVQSSPLVVDHLCRRGEDCLAVAGADVWALPVGWNPFTGSVTVYLEVEATCTPSEDLSQRLQPLLCAGPLMAVYNAAGELQYVTEDSLLGDPPSGLTYEEWSDALNSGGGGDWD